MPIIVPGTTTPSQPTAGLMVSVADYRVMSGDTATDSARLGFLLAQATAAIQRAARQVLTYVASETVTVHADGRDLVLPQRPVVSVESVAGYLAADWYRIDGDTLRLGSPDPGAYYSSDGYLGDYTLGAAGGVWPELVTVTYTHGYDPVPADLQGLVAGMVSRAIANPTGARQESIEDYSVAYGAGAVVGVGMTADERTMVRRDYGRTSGTVRIR